MANLREFIASQSTLPDGALVRDHIQNPCDCGGGTGETVYVLELAVDVALECNVVAVDLSSFEIEVVAEDFEVPVESDIDVEVDADNPDIKVDVCRS